MLIPVHVKDGEALLYIHCLILSFFLVVLGLRCCARAFSSCGERGLLFIAVHGLLIVVASLCCGARALGAGFSSCGMWAQ